MKRHFRWMAMLLVIGGLTSLVWTHDASADSKHRGWGIVMSRDFDKSTLEIGNQVYQVTTRTVFKDQGGGLITFQTLHVFDVHQGLFSMDDATKVEFVSVTSSNGPELESVQVVTELPE